MATFALVHRQLVVDVVTLDGDERPGRSDLAGAYWVDVTNATTTPTRGQRYDGFSFSDP